MKHSINTTHGSVRAQRGAASLIVVLLLFLVLSLTAAYTSRNLVFEQKTSANQARSTTAFEAADAGLEWTLTQLNGGRVDDNCVESAAAGALSFQQRYLTIAANGNIVQTPRAGASPSPRVWPTCVYNGTSWSCACPADLAVDPAAPTTPGSFPAFRVWPAVKEQLLPTDSPWTVNAPPKSGLLRLTVAGCTRLALAPSDTCLNYLSRGEIGEGLAGVRALIALRSGLATPPAAAITARMLITPFNASGEPKLYVVNTDSRSNGITVNSSQPIDTARYVATTIPGTPGEFSFGPPDGKLDKLSTPAPAGASYAPAMTGGDRMFASTFGMKRETYRQQPGLRECPSPCSATAINLLLASDPNRIIWVEDNLILDADIGDPLALPTPIPVLLIVNGAVLTLGPGVDIYGFVYMTGGGTATSTINLPDTPTSITGALVAEGELVTSYSGTPAPTSRLTVSYNPVALDLLRTTYGSWVRVPGSWRDYTDPIAP